MTHRALTLSVLAGAFLARAWAQAPATPPSDTPAARQFSGWLSMFNSGDRPIIQQFLDKNIPGRNAEATLTIRGQIGTLEFIKTESSTETQFRGLARSKDSGDYLHVTINVDAAEPHRIVGVGLQPAQAPEGAAAPARLSEKEAAAAREQPQFRQFTAWLQAFNSGDRETYRKYVEANFPS